MVEFFFATGCGVGEAARWNRRGVDWQRGSVVVVGKGNKEREVYLGSKARIWLTRYFSERQDADPALWVAEQAPHRMSIHGLQGVFKRVAARCGLAEKVHAHTMRHTLATTLLNQSRGPLVLSAGLAWAEVTGGSLSRTGGLAENRPAIRLCDKCGFTIEGRKRHAYYQHGRYHDSFIMALLLGLNNHR